MMPVLVVVALSIAQNGIHDRDYRVGNQEHDTADYVQDDDLDRLTPIPAVMTPTTKHPQS